MGDRKKHKSDGGEAREPLIENRKSRFDYAITETLECGLKLVGTEVKSLRLGQASLAEGWVLAQVDPPQLTLMNVTIAEYPPAGRDRQHVPTRVRRMLAHVSEIRKLALAMQAKGCTLVPLKIYFKNGVAKLLVGVATGRKKGDKREHIKEKEAKRDMQRATGARRRL
jgi:SsrA-binding protein